MNNNEDALQYEDPDPETKWQQLKTILQDTTTEVTGYPTWKNRDCFDENDAEIQNLLQKRRSCLRESLLSQKTRQIKQPTEMHAALHKLN